MGHTTPEKKVQNKIIKYLQSIDYKHRGPLMRVRRNSDEPNYVEGSADIYVVINGVHIEIEIKRPGGERSTAQIRWERICSIIGAPYLVTDNVEDVIKIVNKYAKEKDTSNQ